MAHRGASKSAPENTLAAFRAARSAGADLYELDVQQTKDQELVVIHDATLARTTNAEEVFPDRSPWRVRDFTLAELRQLDAGSWFGARYAGEPIPTLSDVLRVMKGTPGLLLEVKRPAGAPGMAESLAALLPQAPPTTIIQSFDWQFIKSLHTRTERAVLGTPTLADLPQIAKYARYISVKHEIATPAYVRRAHALGLKVLTYTVNTRRATQRQLRAGVDGLITNRPRNLRYYLPAGPTAPRWKPVRSPAFSGVPLVTAPPSAAP
ncbi:glycerophosphodiester phosphodiesterase family protein [Nonomuraea sp. NBC_01738]|uniref:glycerophosphodiester phosphodiesterase n=1 Tax=Nonomuraea sp. NBC_01738 TaxID=2976003 RepID=UPI002E0DEB3E|nr:glycerophosphodiester phosphodiesterase family protein [Nonomuraea sp. NBC_01738]